MTEPAATPTAPALGVEVRSFLAVDSMPFEVIRHDTVGEGEDAYPEPVYGLPPEYDLLPPHARAALEALMEVDGGHCVACEHFIGCGLHEDDDNPARTGVVWSFATVVWDATGAWTVCEDCTQPMTPRPDRVTRLTVGGSQ